MNFFIDATYLTEGLTPEAWRHLTNTIAIDNSPFTIHH